MDIEVIIKKGVIFSTLMASIIGVYSLLIFLGQNIFQETLRINQWIATIITAFVIAVGYKPLETYITNITDKYFFRKKYDYQKTLKDSSEAMNLLTDIDRLVKLTTRIVARRMELEEASTLIYDEPRHKYLVRAAEGKSRDLWGTTYSDNFELFKHLFSSKQILLKDEVVNTLNSKLIMPDERKRLTTIRKEMDKLHAQMCVPSITRGKYMGNKLVAVFCMGTKKSGDMYSNEDIQLLSTLSNQAAVAVENAIMYSDLMKQFQELKETKDQLVQSEKLAALGTMAAGIAHEIKNPLTSLQLFSQMMAERFDDHEFREKFTQIVPPEIERLNKIVNELVSFAKPSKLIMEPAQVNDILDKTIRLSEISFKKLNVKVIKEFGPVPAVMCDQQKLMQIFLNLIMNGSQSMASGGTLTVRTYFDDINKNVCIDIKDTGHGITEENMKKIFAPFFTTKEGGTGLGLAITKRIVEEHKGKIKIKSAVGEGTTFTVELPVAAAS
jgi:C4-dicarboxylate-specific signal transduction histidine kinase